MWSQPSPSARATNITAVQKINKYFFYFLEVLRWSRSIIRKTFRWVCGIYSKAMLCIYLWDIVGYFKTRLGPRKLERLAYTHRQIFNCIPLVEPYDMITRFWDVINLVIYFLRWMNEHLKPITRTISFHYRYSRGRYKCYVDRVKNTTIPWFSTLFHLVVKMISL